MKTLEINNRRYLGSKFKLLNFIDETIKNNCSNVKSIADIFSGTGVVGNYFLNLGYEVYFNDILKSNYITYKAWFGSQDIDLEKLKGIIDNYNNNMDFENNYFSDNFSNTYFSQNDCRKIGTIREDIEKKYNDKQINEREKSVLIASLIYSMDKIANTVGHYDAYRKLPSLEDKFFLYMINVTSKNNDNAHIYNMDSNKLIKQIEADLIYIDPPYNSRQYGDSYHLLENIANWEKPKVYGVAKKMDRKELRSNYCTNKAYQSFEELIDNCKCKYILVSYNNTGNKANQRSNAKISDLQIKEILGKKGSVKVFEKDYNNFSVKKGEKKGHKERLFLCHVEKNEKINEIKLENEKAYAKSPLNFTGGKFKLLPELNNIFPKKIDTFVDFFCGGANVACNVDANKIIAIDKETTLINTLNLFKNYDCTYIINKLEEIIKKYNLSNTYENGYEYYKCDSNSGLGKYNKNNYLKLRDDFNNQKDDKDFLFLTLIIFSFNHQIRFNNAGKFNMPVGKRDFNGSIRKNLVSFCKKIVLNDISFVNCDYKDFDISNLGCNDFCYFDPPYLLGCATYNENDGWNTTKEKELLDFLSVLNEKKIKFALSNVIKHKGKTNNLLINWANDNLFNIHNLQYNYSNSNYHLKNKLQMTKEVVITNY